MWNIKVMSNKDFPEDCSERYDARQVQVRTWIFRDLKGDDRT